MHMACVAFFRMHFMSCMHVLMQIRVSALLLISFIVHAIILIEQPQGSSTTFPRHPRFEWICNRVAYAPSLIYVCIATLLLLASIYNNTFALPEVFKIGYWMMHHGGPTPKRSQSWSTSYRLLQALAPPLDTAICTLSICTSTTRWGVYIAYALHAGQRCASQALSHAQNEAESCARLVLI